MQARNLVAGVMVAGVLIGCGVSEGRVEEPALRPGTGGASGAGAGPTTGAPSPGEGGHSGDPGAPTAGGAPGSGGDRPMETPASGHGGVGSDDVESVGGGGTTNDSGVAGAGGAEGEPPVLPIPKPPIVGRSGLPWPSGVFPERLQSAAQADKFGSWRGRPVDVAVVAAERTSWSLMTRDVYLFAQDYFPPNWSGLMVISLGMWPDGGGNMSDCAAGRYDEHFAAFGSSMVAANRAASVVRIGWEFNGDWMAWSGHDPEQYKQCFRKIASAIRKTNPQVLIDWTANGRSTATCGGSAVNCYPGNDAVDIVGIDYYDKWPPSRSVEEFEATARMPDSLYPLFEFAKSNGKKFAVGEWGVVTQSGDYGDRKDQLGGDNPVFVEQMLAFFRANAAHIAYEAYFSTCRKDGEVGSDLFECGPINPQAGARYLELMR